MVFDSDEEMNKFINYAASTKKTSDPGLNRLRQGELYNMVLKLDETRSVMIRLLLELFLFGSVKY